MARLARQLLLTRLAGHRHGLHRLFDQAGYPVRMGNILTKNGIISLRSPYPVEEALDHAKAAAKAKGMLITIRQGAGFRMQRIDCYRKMGISGTDRMKSS